MSTGGVMPPVSFWLPEARARILPYDYRRVDQTYSQSATPLMDTKKIRFVSNRPWLTENSASRPGPIIKTLPDWYRNADWFVPDPATGKPAEAPDGSGKMPTWKACPAVLDVMGTGYTYKTPCD